MTVPLRWVERCSSKGPFTGNPAGVCVVDESPPETWMQQLAFELGIAETAFVVALGRRRVRPSLVHPGDRD